MRVTDEELAWLVKRADNDEVDPFDGADPYFVAALARELIAARKLRDVMRWIESGAHTGGHTLPDIKEAANKAITEYDEATK